MKIKNLKSKILIAVAGIILLAGILAGFNSMTKKQSKIQKYTEEVVVTPTVFMKISQPDVNTSSWTIFKNENFKLSIKYPENVIIDERQTVKDKIYVFIFEEDKEEPLPGKVTALYVANTHKKGIDGFNAFRRGDCGKECKVSYRKVSWVNINNMYGIKNPMPDDVQNYFLTDKIQSGSVINVYVGGYVNTKDKEVQEKLKTFEQMIKTVRFEYE